MKFRYLISYLFLRRFLPLVIVIDNKGEVLVCIDRVHTVFNNSKEYSGLYFTMSKGTMINILKKLSVVTTSLIEIEAVLNCKHFLKYS